MGKIRRGIANRGENVLNCNKIIRAVTAPVAYKLSQSVNVENVSFLSLFELNNVCLFDRTIEKQCTKYTKQMKEN